MPRRPSYSASELGEVAAGLRRLLDVIAKGEVTARPAEVRRIEGAVAVLEALVTGPHSDVIVPN